MHRLSIVAGFSLALLACGKSDAPAKQTEASSEPAAPAPTPVEKAAKTPTTPEPATPTNEPATPAIAEWVVTADAFGPIAKTTTIDEMKKLFPGHTVEESIRSSEGIDYPILRVKSADKTILELELSDGHISAVSVLGPKLRFGGLMEVGDPAWKLAKVGAKKCYSGADDSKVRCPVDGHVFLYEMEKTLDPGQEIAIKKLGETKITGFRWIASN